MIKHPAKYNDKLLPIMAELLIGTSNIIDQFGGTGKIFELKNYGYTGSITCVEIEPEWAAYDERIIIGDALDLSFPSNYFDGCATSVCLAHGQRILRKDLRWIPVENIKVGDEIISFDEFNDKEKTNGTKHRRKFNIGKVLRSEPKLKQCLRVNLSNGDSIICTPEHPWLTQKFKSGGNGKTGASFTWMQAKDLMSPDYYSRRVHGKWTNIKRKSIGVWVLKQFIPWDDNKSYESGWLAGIFDGEGSIIFKNAQLKITQIVGEISDLVRQRLSDCGFAHNTYVRKDTLPHNKPINNIYVIGGISEIFRALGTLRPTRLLAKLNEFDISCRCIEAEKIRVVSVEPAGEYLIQEIETSTGTYFGEGYLHHNCYGNRMADSHIAKDNSKRITYTHSLGRKLHPNNSGQLQWGSSYKLFHLQAWMELIKVLKDGSTFVLNCKNHIRDGQEQFVTEWHKKVLEDMGFHCLQWHKIRLPGMGFGQNAKLRVEYESLLKFRLDK